MKPKQMVKNARSPKGFWGKLMIKAMNRGHAELSEWGLSFLPKREYSNGLDVGCGGGENIKRLLKFCNNTVYGTDISPLCVEKSSKNCERFIKNGKVKINVGSAEKLDFSDNSMSLVSAVETVYFWNGIENCFKEIYRVLENNGVFIIINEMTATEEDYEKYSKITDLVEMKVYTTNELKALLRATEFEILDIQSLNNWTCIVARKGE